MSQVILLRIRNGEKSHYAAVRKPIWVKIYFIWERKLKSHEKGCKNHDNSQMVMPEKNKNILKYNQYKKFLKTPFAIYSDSEPLFEETQICNNNPEESSTTKISK